MLQALGCGDTAMFKAPQFLMPRACRDLIALIDANNHPSTVADFNGDYAFRTSSTCDMDGKLPVVDTVRTSIAKLLGVPLENTEPLQGQVYDIGQEFKAHNDWFRPDSEDFNTYCSVGGQRTWTAMAYLNRVEAGGETLFPQLGLKVVPEPGTLLMWDNMRPDGKPNPRVIHHAKPVLAGRKHVITLWFRERRYAN
jgi:prolyl 4-hydroxylase